MVIDNKIQLKGSALCRSVGGARSSPPCARGTGGRASAARALARKLRAAPGHSRANYHFVCAPHHPNNGTIQLETTLIIVISPPGSIAGRNSTRYAWHRGGDLHLKFYGFSCTCVEEGGEEIGPGSSRLINRLFVYFT
jgi:hypothetical protein